MQPFYGHYTGQLLFAGTSLNNWTTVLEWSFTVCVTLLMAASAIRLGREQCYLHCLCTVNNGTDNSSNKITTTTTTVLRPFVRDYPVEPVPEETLTHPPSWSPSNLYQLLPSTTINSILPVQIPCLAIFMHNLSPCPLWSTSWSGALLHLIFHAFLHLISLFFSQQMPIPSQPVLL